MGSIGRGERGSVIGANASVPVPEFGRLPVGAITLALADELQIAIESLEAGGAQRRGHLALQARFGMIVGTARCLRYGQWNRALIRRPAPLAAPDNATNDSATRPGTNALIGKPGVHHGFMVSPSCL